MVFKAILGTSLAIVLLAPWAAPADALELALQPQNTQLRLTVYAMGMFARAGHFDRFTGTLSLDPAHPQSCKLTLDVQVDSLTMSTAMDTRMALSPTMMDPAHFPTLTYRGDCDPAHANGTLTMHGVTRNLSPTTTRDAHALTARGTLKRQDFAIRGYPALIGSTINIVVTVQLPPHMAEALPR